MAQSVFNVGDLQGEIDGNKIKCARYSGTTNANGYLVTNIPTTKRIIAAYGLDYPATFITYNGVWYFFIFHPNNGTIVPDANASRGVDYYYVDYGITVENA